MITIHQGVSVTGQDSRDLDVVGPVVIKPPFFGKFKAVSVTSVLTDGSIQGKNPGIMGRAQIDVGIVNDSSSLSIGGYAEVRLGTVRGKSLNVQLVNGSIEIGKLCADLINFEITGGARVAVKCCRLPNSSDVADLDFVSASGPSLGYFEQLQAPNINLLGRCEVVVGRIDGPFRAVLRNQSVLRIQATPTSEGTIEIFDEAMVLIEGKAYSPIAGVHASATARAKRRGPRIHAAWSPIDFSAK